MAEPLDEETVARLVGLVDPDWTVREVAPIERGFSRIARLVVGTPEGPRDCILKAAPEAGHAGTAADARVTAVLDRHTDIPVATVLGAVDEHDDLPAPCYLAEAVDGRELGYERVGWFDDDELRALARDTGAALGELHALDAVDGFGHVTHDPGAPLHGDQPAGRLDSLTVGNGTDEWLAYLRAYAEKELDRHADSRFDGVTPALSEWVEERLAALEGPFEPALCRNDHGLHNALLDDDGGVAAMLDWAYTLSTPPAFDVAFATYIYGGAYLAGIEGVPDRRSLVGEALRAGYREAAADGAVPDREPLYELLAATRIMNDFDQLAPGLPEGTESAAAEGLRENVESML